MQEAGIAHTTNTFALKIEWGGGGGGGGGGGASWSPRAMRR